MGVSNMTLVKIGSIGGIITVTMGLALRAKLNNDVKQTEFYKKAMSTLRTHKAAVYLLGEPMKEGNIDVGNSEKNYVLHHTAKYEVPIKGPKQNGILYIWANKQADTGQWILNRLELGLKNEPERRLLIKGDKANESPINDASSINKK